MKTAMEWYFEEEEKFRRGQTKHFSVGPIQKKALEKEKEQIVEAYSQGYGDGVQEPNPNDNYYNQTYNQNK